MRPAVPTLRLRRLPAPPSCEIRAFLTESITSFVPNWLADFRFGFFRYRVAVNPNGLGTSPAKDAGIPGLNLDPTYTSGMPHFNLGTVAPAVTE